MGRDHSRSTITRRNQGTRQVRKIILYVEGRNTEPSYFELLKRSYCKVIPVTVAGQGVGSCIRFVEEANTRYKMLPSKTKEKYLQKWLVYDCDGHNDFVESINTYDSNTKSVNEDFFDLMMASNPDSKTPRVIEAYKRAKTIHLRKKGQGSEFRESVTTVYELLKELGVVIEKEDGDLKLNI